MNVFMGDSSPSKPEVSFIVPAHNEERELPATLTAIQAAAVAVQSEVIVVNDASTDATAAIAQKFGARLVQIERRQIAAARNAGGRVANGKILIFIDADTRITPAQVDGVRDAIARGFAGGGARLRIEGEIPRWAAVFLRLFSAVYFGLNFGAGAFLFTTRENFHRVGGFDERYFAGEEVFFTRAIRKIGRFKILSVPALTSGRKLRLYRKREVLRATVSLLFGGRQALRSRHKLAIWYDGARESS